MSDNGAQDSGAGEGEATFVVIDAVFSADDLATLTNELRRIFRAPAGDGADPVTDLQNRYAVALVRIAEFVERSGIGDDIGHHFAQLAEAFYDLHRGRQVEVLTPKTPANRPPTSTDVWAVRACAVCAVEWFMRSGLTLTGAIERVAKEHDLGPALDGAVPPKPRQVSLKLQSSLKTWRDTIKLGRAADVAHGIYQRNSAQIASCEEWLPQQLEAHGYNVLETAVAGARRLIK
jgi:hypothetical protein